MAERGSATTTKNKKINQDAAGKWSLKSEDSNLMTSYEWEVLAPCRELLMVSTANILTLSAVIVWLQSLGFFFSIQCLGVEHESIFSSAGKSSLNEFFKETHFTHKNTSKVELQ